MSCGGAKKPGQGHTAQEYGCGRQVVGISDGETKQWGLIAPLAPQNVPSFALGAGLWRTLSVSPRTSPAQSHFSLSEGCTL